MGCFANGEPIGPVLVAPVLQHWRFQDSTTAAAAETISIVWVATAHVRMEQLLAHWDAIPTVSEFLILTRIHATDARIDTVLRSVDPSLFASGGENLTDFACVIPFYWEIGDSVQITYPNLDNQAVGVDIMLTEVP